MEKPSIMSQMNFLGGLLFAFCLVLPLISAKTADVHYCKNTIYAVNVTSLDIDPYPISTGKNTKFQITAYTSEAISGGKLVIDVSYIGLHIHSEDHDLCKETSCPVSVGNFKVTHAQKLPWYTPWGSYTLEMKMVDSNGNELTCISFGFSIGFIAEESKYLADI